MSLAPKILVADDDQALSRTLSWILKENGYEVLTVPGGEMLFEHLQAEAFDLLLLDIMMPKIDGLQLLQRVKADPRFKDLPVLMISSMPPEEATVRSLGLGEPRSEEHTSELQSPCNLVCRLLLEKKKQHNLRLSVRI